MQLNNWLIVIPARLASTRLPNKPLQEINGKTLLQLVFENLKSLELCGASLITAIDSKEVEAVCLQNKIPYKMTRADHASGTDRVNEVAQPLQYKYVMNVQGDEPFVDLEDLKRLALEFQQSNAAMGTLGFANTSLEDFSNPNIVKIIKGTRNQAIYFSRAAIPHPRERSMVESKDWFFWQHQGIYVFRKETLFDFCKLPKSSLEDCEKLEQLRAVEAGWQIHITQAHQRSFGIDTPEDLVHAQKILSKR